MVSINSVVASNDGEARREFTAYQQFTVNNICRGLWRTLPRPTDTIDQFWSPRGRDQIHHMLRRYLVCSPETVGVALADLISEVERDEIIVTATNADHPGRVRTQELLAAAHRSLAG